MYNKTIIRFSFCDIQNNQGLGNYYQTRPSDSGNNPYLDPVFFRISQNPHPIIVYYHSLQFFFLFHWPTAHQVTSKQLPTNNGLLMRMTLKNPIETP